MHWVPREYRQLLACSRYEAPTLAYASAIASVLEDNKTPFFPAYTDHGISHISGVLAAAVKLTPRKAWPALTASDAAAMVCAASLHDIAMHFRDAQFVTLVRRESLPRPSWFAHGGVNYQAELPWAQVWKAFQSEVRRMGSGQLETIVGTANTEAPRVAHEADLIPSNWGEPDRLIVGEFLRRHHARLAHEIALDGWPSLPHSEFPLLSELMPDVADGIGAIARSHNVDLRVMIEYCNYMHPGNLRPWGVLAAFAMALLRVADYLQIDAQRAPPILLHLRSLANQRSIDEWNKHSAIAQVGWTGTDPMAVYVTAGQHITSRSYFQVQDLLRDLQREMDISAAVLDETYKDEELDALRLARGRVVSNFTAKGVVDRLPFAPIEARLHSDPDLFRLIIRPLYGDKPSIAVRELIQNAVDAVRALNRHRNTLITDGKPDVIVELEELQNEEAILRVIDRGVGMTPETVGKYFLAAGASLGPTATEFEGMEPVQASAWLKTGRFGIGAFASFLLGTEVSVRTRHVDCDRAVEFTIRDSSDIIELQWCDGPVGTVIEIPFDRSRIERAHSVRNRTWGGTLVHFIRQFIDYYRCGFPVPLLRLRSASLEAELARLHDQFEGRLFCSDEFTFREDVPCSPDDTKGWISVDAAGFDAVLWSFRDKLRLGSHLVHNGFLLDDYWHWSDGRMRHLFETPAVAVVDSRHNLDFDVTRAATYDRSVPFERELLTSIGCELATQSSETPFQLHAGVINWSSEYAIAKDGWLPFVPQLVSALGVSRVHILWDEDWREVPGWQERFLSGELLEWTDDEIRVILPLNTESPPGWGTSYRFGRDDDPLDAEDRVYAGVVAQSVAWIEWLANWETRGTLARTWGTDERQFRLTGPKGWSRDRGFRVGSRPARQYVGRTQGTRMAKDVKSSLSRCLDAVTHGRGGIAAVSAFRIADGQPRYGQELVDGWLAVSPGAIPFGPREKDAYDAWRKVKQDRHVWRGRRWRSRSA